MDQNYALIQGGIVINTIVWNGDTETWSPPHGETAVLIPSGQAVSIGWAYSGSTFTPPA